MTVVVFSPAACITQVQMAQKVFPAQAPIMVSRHKSTIRNNPPRFGPPGSCCAPTSSMPGKTPKPELRQKSPDHP